MNEYIQGKLIKINDISPRVKQFFWQANNVDSFDYTPGQFCIIHFPKLGGSMPHRSYSIADIEDNVVEFCISKKEGGQATDLLWKMKVGDELEVSEAKGHFTLREPFAPKIIFIATGTGVAPFRAMIKEMIAQKTKSEIHLVFGNRFLTDILYHQHWLDLEQEITNFHYHPILSREPLNNRKGYVHELYPTLFKPGEKVQFYICGWNEMIKETRKNLKAKGFSRKEYFIESYD